MSLSSTTHRTCSCTCTWLHISKVRPADTAGPGRRWVPHFSQTSHYHHRVKDTFLSIMTTFWFFFWIPIFQSVFYFENSFNYFLRVPQKPAKNMGVMHPHIFQILVFYYIYPHAFQYIDPPPYNLWRRPCLHVSGVFIWLYRCLVILNEML